MIVLRPVQAQLQVFALFGLQQRVAVIGPIELIERGSHERRAIPRMGAPLAVELIAITCIPCVAATELRVVVMAHINLPGVRPGRATKPRKYAIDASLRDTVGRRAVDFLPQRLYASNHGTNGCHNIVLPTPLVLGGLKQAWNIEGLGRRQGIAPIHAIVVVQARRPVRC